MQRAWRIVPCSSSRFRLPAAACRPSTFCVTSVMRGRMRSMRASARCPSFGRAARTFAEAPRVEPPHFFGVAREGLGRREILRAIPFPEPAGSPKRRKAALVRDARSGQHGERAPGQEPGQEVEERRQREARSRHLALSNDAVEAARPELRRNGHERLVARGSGPHGEIPHAARGRRAGARGFRRRLRARRDSRHLGARRRRDRYLGEHGETGQLRELRIREPAAPLPAQAGGARESPAEKEPRAGPPSRRRRPPRSSRA